MSDIDDLVEAGHPRESLHLAETSRADDPRCWVCMNADCKNLIVVEREGLATACKCGARPCEECLRMMREHAS